jgi:AraC-like DNA-binding protein
MKKLLETTKLEGNKILWDYQGFFTKDFKSYYHWHQCWEWLFVHEGKGTVVVNRQTYEMERGMLFLFRPYQLHHIHVEPSPEQPYIRSIFYFDPLYAEALLRDFSGLQNMLRALWHDRECTQVFWMREQAKLMEWAYEQYNETGHKGVGIQDEEFLLLLVQLLQIIRSQEALQHQSHGAKLERSHGYSEHIMRYIDEHYREELSLDMLAESLHLSKTYLSRLFKSETGSSITEYLTARRIREACKLLETTELPVERIGAETGFPNSSYFIQLFRRKVGVTPLKYRKE